MGGTFIAKALIFAISALIQPIQGVDQKRLAFITQTL
jgi:hypothetical protein